MRTKLIPLLALAIITCMVGATGALAAQAKYTYTDLGSLSGNNTYPVAMNNSATAVGKSLTAPLNADHAFFWTKNQGMLDLGTLSQLGLNRSCAWGVNSNSTRVVGECWNLDFETYGPNPLNRAFQWQKTTGLVDLGTLGGNNSGAYACNNQGWIVGCAETSTLGTYHAFYWTKNNGLRDLDNRPGKFSTAWAVNDLNQVVGEMETATPQIYHGFLWTRNGGMRDLGPLPGGASCAAFSLNYTHILGVSENAAGNVRGVWWQISNYSITDLGDLGGRYVYPYGINFWDQVVGTSETATPGVFHAFLRSSSTGVQDLNDLVVLPSGYTLTCADSINNNGQIIVEAVGPEGIVHAFLLTPTTTSSSPQALTSPRGLVR